jgi:hypothetical protein
VGYKLGYLCILHTYDSVSLVNVHMYCNVWYVCSVMYLCNVNDIDKISLKTISVPDAEPYPESGN